MGADGPRAASVSARTRQYDSTLRRRQAEETRRRILDAATALFSDRGWSAGMRDIASAAGVSFETVYANFGSKPGLLNQVLDVAVVGDDQPVALIDRPEFAALAHGTHRERAAAAASLVTGINGRTMGLMRALREASAVAPALASRLEDERRRQRMTVQVAGALMTGRDLSSTESDGLWAVITVEVYELLTGGAGWSPGQYEDWLAGAITRLLALEE
ncbi:TetR/AcrR family transcriptional regulator [Rhodococcus sp. AG1013]|uniref:TetR/AcrR family transcriptional regulator n=1 Tax=Rhodococcus sp. AG1013 TaxID=2183996 RepID=UPI000E0CA527|nr:TetR family transcriptional regulator [Rhodococcus sp. AG1013]